MQMKIGDVYVKHVRGSRYAFNGEGIFYKYPGRNQAMCTNVDADLLNRLRQVRKAWSGRFIVNERGEVVVYCEEKKRWTPYYCGMLGDELMFDGLNNNPADLKSGLLWTGLASHHGSKMTVDAKGHVWFKESLIEGGCKTLNKYPVRGLDEDVIDTILSLKQDQGSFHVNEHGHIWAPVSSIAIADDYDGKIIDKEALNLQLKEMTDVQKRTVKSYGERTTQRRVLNESWFPIYVGQCTEPLVIARPDKPHIIISEDELFEEWNNTGKSND